MTQNIVSLNLTDDELQAVDAALSELENKLGGLIALSVPQKRSLRKMGEKSEAFCRQAMRLLAQNPELVPANVVAASPVQDLAMLDKLRPRLLRIVVGLDLLGEQRDAALPEPPRILGPLDFVADGKVDLDDVREAHQLLALDMYRAQAFERQEIAELRSLGAEDIAHGDEPVDEEPLRMAAQFLGRNP